MQKIRTSNLRFVDEQGRTRIFNGMNIDDKLVNCTAFRYPLDEAFLDALARMPPAGGVALGMDRLVMLVCGVDDISTVRAGE